VCVGRWGRGRVLGAGGGGGVVDGGFEAPSSPFGPRVCPTVEGSIPVLVRLTVLSVCWPAAAKPLTWLRSSACSASLSSHSLHTFTFLLLSLQIPVPVVSAVQSGLELWNEVGWGVWTATADLRTKSGAHFLWTQRRRLLPLLQRPHCHPPQLTSTPHLNSSDGFTLHGQWEALSSLVSFPPSLFSQLLSLSLSLSMSWC
jgi:hypothetical protein